MKCPLLKTSRNEIDTNGMIKHIEEFQDCIGKECGAYVPEVKEKTPYGTEYSSQFEDCRMMRK